LLTEMFAIVYVTARNGAALPLLKTAFTSQPLSTPEPLPNNPQEPPTVYRTKPWTPDCTLHHMISLLV